ncbi:hypothetical protein SAY86_008273 [Trapa natans]|uniref:Uncharacterized protein n=1 Tax=Trapa natans TaxID=22666 RepID=A0AAN7KGX0_TRANT|nr:hypothetical protein SAY86_008273 [Trapa natans]
MGPNVLGARGSRIPTVVTLGPTGRTVTAEARELIMKHNHDTYPFTEEHLKKLNAKMEEIVKSFNPRSSS